MAAVRAEHDQVGMPTRCIINDHGAGALLLFEKGGFGLDAALPGQLRRLVQNLLARLTPGLLDRGDHLRRNAIHGIVRVGILDDVDDAEVCVLIFGQVDRLGQGTGRGGRESTAAKMR